MFWRRACFSCTLMRRMDTQIERIRKLIGSDEGFYLVALHSFVELYMKNNFPGYEERIGRNFSDNLMYFKKHLAQSRKTPGLDSLDAIRREHTLVYQVLHDFVSLDPEEARAATSNFIGFCMATGLYGTHESQLLGIKDSLHLWDEKTSRAEEYENLRNVKWQLFELKQEHKELINHLAEFEAAKDRVVTLEAQLRILEHRIKLKSESPQHSRIADAKLSKEKGEVKEELQQKIKDLEKMARIRDYLTKLSRLATYTRTRSDYEKQVLTLSEEQADALARINLNTDFLIQGAAGTGKTLVLLKALQKAVVQRETQGVLWSPEEENAGDSILLLSYTKTLVKYNKYLASLLDIQSGGKDQIDTADSFIFQLLKYFNPDCEVNFNILSELVTKYMHSGKYATGLNYQQLYAEIEDFIYANKISREEYCTELIPRTGMGFSLTKEERILVWNIKTDLEAAMLERKSLSRGFAHNLICASIEQSGTPRQFMYGYVFVDESQDLKPADLWILKAVAGRHIILAGDVDQTIYGVTQPYTKAEIDIQGKTKILKMNHRSTIPIITLSEEFKERVRTKGEQSKTGLAEGFREGPVPELFVESGEDKLLQFLYSKLEILLTHIQYDPGNINILVPTRKLVAKIESFLSGKGIKTIQYTDDRFEFSDTDAVRISTLHSAKGLDMPVVMLFLPYWPFSSGSNYTPVAQTRLSNNLLYVAMSRAMDILDLFIDTEISGDSPIKELVETYDEVFTKNRKMKKQKPQD